MFSQSAREDGAPPAGDGSLVGRRGWRSTHAEAAWRFSAADHGRNDSAEASSQNAWNRAGPVPSTNAPGFTKS